MFLAQARLHRPVAQSEELTEDTLTKPLLLLLRACEDSLPFSLTEHLNTPECALYKCPPILRFLR